MDYRILWRAIQKKCLDCCGGHKEEVENCLIRDCPLFPYRLGDRQGNLLANPNADANKKCHE